MLQAENLRKTFTVREKKGFLRGEKRTVEAVKDVSLRLERGQVVGLLGINGAGKTTTIKMLTTLLQPTGGRYTLDGVDAVKRHAEVKRRVNMVAGGERMVYWRLTAWENLWYFGSLYDVPKPVLKARIPALLRLVGLEGREHVPVETFSKGMKQRLQIARGLVNDPDYLLMDEPTIGLDPVVAKDLRGYVGRLAREEGKGVLLTSHYLGEVEELCGWLYILDAGRLLYEGDTASLVRRMFSHRRYVLRTAPGAEPAEALREGLAGLGATAEAGDEPFSAVIKAKGELGTGLSALCAAEGLVIRELYEQRPTLEDALLRMAREAKA